MKTTTVIETRRGIRAAIARFFERINVAVTMRAAEQDLEHYRKERDRLPRVMALMESDLEALRVRKARLQKPISQPEMQ